MDFFPHLLRIRIGAPRGNDPRYPKIHHPGIVYNCEVKMGCKPMKFQHLASGDPYEDEIWENGWIGGTMDISYSKQRFVVCGFRRYYKYHFVNFNEYFTRGTCLWSFLNSTDLKTITPLLAKDDSIKHSVYWTGQGQAGFSAHFPENKNELLLGAPGFKNWAGTPFRVFDQNYSTPESNRRRRDIYPFKNVEVPDPSHNAAFNLFGYSVTSGFFYGNDTLYYAASSPKDLTYIGKVVIFTFNASNYPIIEKEHKVGQQFGEYFGGSLASGRINDDVYDDLLVGAPYFSGKTYNEGRVYIFLGGRESLKLPTILSGKHKGSQFGASIMYMGDLNMDGFGDVAIGAPYENENTGTVYIYKGTNNGLQLQPSQIIIGKDISSNIMGFGITISKPIDMDHNRYADITIGAPLSNSAVFLRSRPFVVIRYSFSSDPKMLSTDLKNFTMNICFSYSMFQGNSVDITYNITMDKSLGRAKIGTNTSVSQNITISKNNQPLCHNISVTIKKSSDLNIEMPIKASVSYWLNYPIAKKSVTIITDSVQEDNDNLCVTCPELDEIRSNETFFETDIPFTLDCGMDNKCQSFLNIDIRFPELSEETFILGSSNYLKLQATVENTAENAYSTKLYLVLPESVFFRQFPPKCKSENASAMLCDIANPLKMSKNKPIDLLELDVRNLNNKFDKDHIDIYSRIITSSNNTNSDTLIYSLKLRRAADITIYGTTQQQTNYYGDSSINSSLLTHIYKVEKYGFSSLEKLIVKIQVPFKYKIDNEQITFLETSGVETYFGGQPFTCKIDGIMVQKRTKLVNFEENSQRRRRDVEVFRNISEENIMEELKINDDEVTIANKTLFLNCSTPEVTCFNIICNLGPYDIENAPASIQLNMMVNLTMIADVAKTMDMVLISSNGQVWIDSPKNFVQTGDREDSVVISSVFINDITKQGVVALWIIILAVIIGLLLLFLLILLFIKIGFFRRTKKEALKNLKAAALQEDKIMEIVQDSNEQEESGEEMKEIDPPSFENVVISSKEDLCDK